MKDLQRRVFLYLQPGVDESNWEKVFDFSILALITLNVVIVIAETFPLPQEWLAVFDVIETGSILVFTVEYLLRLWTAPLLYPTKTPSMARLKYVFSFMAIIDLLAILPFYLPFVFPVDLRVLRSLRLIRLLRLLKINRYTNALYVIGQVFKAKASQLISSVLVVGLLMLISSVLMYYIENPVQPDVFENAFSGLWWAVATFTTVGYGDIYPITAAGRFISAVIALLGIGMVAVPTGIISAGFIETMDKADDTPEELEAEKKHYCPYCGKKID